MAYGIKYTSEFTSQLGVNYKVKVLQKDYASAITELVMGGEPVIINYNGDENKFATLRGSECIVNFYAQFDYQLAEIVKADKNDFRIEIYKDDLFFWGGFVIQDNYNEPFMPVPYLVTLRATDGLGDLKFYDFKTPTGNLYLNKLTQIEVILACLGQLRNGTKLITSIDIYEATIDKSNASNEALNRVFINPVVYLQSDKKVDSCADVVKSILEIYNAYIYYKQGAYYIERINCKLNDVIVQRSYNISFDSPSSTANTVSSSNILGQIGRYAPLKHINNDGLITYQTPYKYLDISNKVNVTEELVLNNKFINWEGSNPKYWLNNGLSVSKTGNTRSDSILLVNTKNNTDSTININSPNISFNVNNFNQFITTTDTFKIKMAHYGNFRIGVKIISPSVTYWLFKTGDNYGWSPDFNTIKIQAPDGSYPRIDRIVGGNWRQDYWFVNEIESLPTLNTTFNQMQIFLYPAFDNTAGYKNDLMVIRELSIKYNYNNTNDFEGYNLKFSTDKNYTETYSDLDPRFGEFDNVGYTNQLMLSNQTGYTYTQNWARAGKVESKSLLQLASTSILNQYRTPYVQYSGSFKGEFDFGKVYNFNSLLGRYMPYKATMNLKDDTSTVDFFELLPESDLIESTYSYSKTVDLGSDGYNTISYTPTNTNGVAPWRAGRG